MSDALVFPGQGSQSQGMQADLAAEFDFGFSYAFPHVRLVYSHGFKKDWGGNDAFSIGVTF